MSEPGPPIGGPAASGSAPPPPPPGASAPRPTGVTLGIGQVLVAIGSIAVIVSNFLNWLDITGPAGTRTETASGVPVQFLFNYTTNSKDPSFVLLLVASAALGLLGAVFAARAPGLRLLAGLGGLLAAATAVGYSFQIHQAIHGSPLESRYDVTDVVGIAPWVAVVGGLAIFIGALIPPPVP